MRRNYRSLSKRLTPAWLMNLAGRIRSTRTPDLDDAIRPLLEKAVGLETEIVVIDVGANTGQSVTRFQRYLKQAIFHTFEPIPSCHALLIDNFQGPNFVHNRVALSNTNGTREFNEFAKRNTSSFLRPDLTSSWASERAAVYGGGKVSNLVADRYEVPCMTLDSYIDKFTKLEGNRIHLLKMDTQGHESQVLEGATKLLSDPLRRPLLIESEVILGAMYESNLSFFDIEKYLIPHGYKLIAIVRGGNILDNPFLNVDVLYASPEMVPVIPR